MLVTSIQATRSHDKIAHGFVIPTMLSEVPYWVAWVFQIKHK